MLSEKFNCLHVAYGAKVNVNPRPVPGWTGPGVSPTCTWLLQDYNLVTIWVSDTSQKIFARMPNGSFCLSSIPCWACVYRAKVTIKNTCIEPAGFHTKVGLIPRFSPQKNNKKKQTNKNKNKSLGMRLEREGRVSPSKSLTACHWQ